MADIPVEKLHEIFEYRDGELYWKERPESDFATKNAWATWNPKYAGKMVGHLVTSYNISYRQTKYRGVRVLVHRVIFAMHHGYYPKVVDHIDGNGSNNKIENLREATFQTNQFNRRINCNSTSGHKNIYWCNTLNKWTVYIEKNGKKHAKRFKKDELDEAVEYAKKLREELFGDYARHE